MLKVYWIKQLRFTFMLYRVVGAVDLGLGLTSATCQLRDPEWVPPSASLTRWGQVWTHSASMRIKCDLKGKALSTVTDMY